MFRREKSSFPIALASLGATITARNGRQLKPGPARNPGGINHIESGIERPA
jgi:hypothetical protein